MFTTGPLHTEIETGSPIKVTRAHADIPNVATCVATTLAVEHIDGGHQEPWVQGTWLFGSWCPWIGLLLLWGQLFGLDGLYAVLDAIHPLIVLLL